MHLVLENFRCYRQRTFELPDEGLTLLHGDSGKGKTTIFKAINFVLYGKEQKTTTFGTRKSSVELVLDQCTIKRTRTPNHLALKTKDGFEAADAAAQAWIDKTFGEHFMQTSYLSQKCLDNFFTQKREDRAVILRMLSIQSFDIDGLKVKNKDHVKVRKLHLQKANNDFRWITDEMRQRGFVEPVVCPVFPLGADVVDHEAALKEEQRQQENNWKKLTLAQQTLMELNVKLQEVLQRTSERFSLEKQLSDLHDVFQELKVTCAEVIVVDEEPLRRCRETLQQLELMLQIEQKQVDLVQAREDHELKRSSQLAEVEQRLAANDYDEREMQAIEDEMKYVSQAMKAVDELSKFGVVLDKTNFKASCERMKDLSGWTSDGQIVEQLALLQQQYDSMKPKVRFLKEQSSCNVHRCPNCKHSLIVVEGRGNVEVKSHNVETVRSELESLEQTQRSLKQRIDELAPKVVKVKEVKERHARFMALLGLYEGYLEDDVTTLSDDWQRVNMEHKDKQKAKEELRVLQQQKQSVEKSVSDVVRYLEKDLVGLRGKLKMAVVSDVSGEIVKTKDSLVMLEQQLASNKYRLAQQRDKQVRKMEVEKEMARLTLLLESVGLDKVDEMRQRINDLNVEVEQRRQKAERFDKRKTLIEEWRLSYVKYQEYTRLNTKREQALRAQNVAERALRVALQFGKYIQDAESQAMQSFLQQLNEECDRHMDVMFDGSLTMKIVYESSSDDEAKKYFVDVVLTRNNEEVTYDSLSGGESDRCALAVFLAFNRLSKSRFLLLDECLSSLHAESVETIVDHIKACFKNKMCIMTLHQTTTGIFDNVVQLD